MTLTSSTIGAVLPFGVVLVAVFCSVTLWRRRIPGLAMGPSLSAALYLTRYAVALEYYGLPRSEIKAHIEALRGDLGAVDAAEITAVRRRLGPPRTLAAEVTSGTLRPSYLRGTIWFGVAVFFALALSVLATEAFLGGFEAVAQEQDQASWSGFGLYTGATMGTNGHVSTIEFGGFLPLLLPVFAFILGSRPWRHRRPPSIQSRTSAA